MAPPVTVTVATSASDQIIVTESVPVDVNVTVESPVVPASVIENEIRPSASVILFTAAAVIEHDCFQM